MMKAVFTAALMSAAIVLSSGQAHAARWVFCAYEGEFCRAPYGATIHFGAEGEFYHIQNDRNGMPCSNRVFGDPISNVHKRCFYSMPRQDYDEERPWRPRPRY